MHISENIFAGRKEKNKNRFNKATLLGLTVSLVVGVAISLSTARNDFSTLPFFIFAQKSQAALLCSSGTGNCDGDITTGIPPSGCETDLTDDPGNCGHCGVKCNGVCSNGSCVSPQGGLIPCGRIADNPATSWDEKASCNLCHGVVLADEVVKFLVKLAGIVALLALVVGGFLYMLASGNAGLMTNAKSGIIKAMAGFLIILLAWLIVSILMVIFGFSDPLGDGRWHILNCDVPMATVDSSCGDGIVQSPEDCERTESLASFQARAGGTIAQWTEMKGKCSYGCSYKCVGDSLESQIGGGCYNPIDGVGNLCQKGKYTCDVDSNTVQCVNIFNNPDYSWDPDYTGSDLYDYCCLDGGLALSAMAVNIVRGPAGNFKCDDVCKTVGGICVGVGLRDQINTRCTYITHDIGFLCQNPGNLTSSNCSATFTGGGGFCDETFAAPTWSMGNNETACYCK